MNKFNSTVKKLVEVYLRAEKDDEDSFYDENNKCYKIELDDSQATFDFNVLKPTGNKDEVDYIGTLEHFLLYDELYSKLPKLKTVQCEITISKDSPNQFAYHKDIKILEIHTKNKSYIKPMFFHEMQHLIQDVCGLIGGANPNFGNDSNHEDDIEIMKLYNEYKNAILYVENKKSMSEQEKLRIDKLKEILDNKIKNCYCQKYNQDSLIRKSSTFTLTLKALNYCRCFGEIQAKDCESRCDLTKDERKKTPRNLKP